MYSWKKKSCTTHSTLFKFMRLLRYIFFIIDFRFISITILEKTQLLGKIRSTKSISYFYFCFVKDVSKVLEFVDFRNAELFFYHVRFRTKSGWIFTQVEPQFIQLSKKHWILNTRVFILLTKHKNSKVKNTQVRNRTRIVEKMFEYSNFELRGRYWA